MSGHRAVPTDAAESMASEIFSAIGVGLEWHNAGPCPASPDVIQISFAYLAPTELPAGALAYALPYEGTHIVVFYERVKLKSGYARQSLAYALVHEIAHIMQGIRRHSGSGIMKASWNDVDYHKMQCKTLGFTADDVRLIHLGLDARAARRVGTEPVQVAAQ